MRTPILTSTNTAGPVQQASGQALGVERVNQGLGVLDAGINNAADALKRAKEKDDAVWTAKAVADARARWAKEQAERELAIENDGKGYALQMQTDFKTYAEEIAGQAPSRDARRNFELAMVNMGGRVASRAIATEATARVDYRGQMAGATIQQEANMVLSDPTAFGESLDNVTVLIDNMQLPPKMRTQLLKNAESSLAQSQVRGLLRSDPVGAMDRLIAGEWDKYLTPDQKNSLLNQARPEAGRAMGAMAWDNAPTPLREALASGDPMNIAKAVTNVVIRRESAGKPGAESPKGASGLMQIMPATARGIARELGMPNVTKMNDAAIKQWLKTNPQENVRFGQHYLAKRLKQYDNNLPMALAAYNAGAGRVDKWIERFGRPGVDISTENWVNSIPIKETREYVQWIMGNLDHGGAQVSVDEIADPVVRRSAKTEVARRETEHKAKTDAYMVGFNDYVASIIAGRSQVGETTRYTRDELLATLGPERGQQAYDAVTRAASVAETIQAAKILPPEDLATMRADLENRLSAEGFIDNQAVLGEFDKLVRQRAKALADDPAAYAAANMLHLQAYDIEEEPEEYAAATLAAQTTLGVPVSQQRVLAKSQSAAMLQSISEAPTGDVAVMLTQMQQQWGDAWPELLRDLRRDGMRGGDLVAAAYVDVSPGLAQQIVAATRNYKELTKGLDDAVLKDIRLNLDNRLADYRHAFTAGAVPGEAIGQFNQLRDSMQAWVVAQLSSDTLPGTFTSTEGQVVDEAVDRFMKSKFLDPIRTGNIHALVPSAWDGQQLSEGKVEAATEVVMTRENIAAFDPQLIGPAGPIAMDRLVDTAVNSGVWVQNDLSDGLQLMVPTQSGVMLPLVDKNGEPFEVTYDNVLLADEPGTSWWLNASPAGAFRMMVEGATGD